MRCTLGQAVRNAIETETAAERFYAGLAKRTDDGDARRFLEDMSVQEGEHAESLERLAEKLDGDVPLSADVDLTEVENGATWAADATLGFTEALVVALENEDMAHQTYLQMGSSCQDPEVQRFFTEMAEAERKHAEQLSDLLEAAKALS